MKRSEMWKAALENGTVYFDEMFGAWMYLYSDCGWTDEIVLGSDKEDAYRVFCEINW